MPKQLTTQNATITTAAVEVKTLTISGKQVTLAVFRQLQEVPILAEDCTLNGEPWGVVNYHPDKCVDAADHLHIVWQKGEQLLRSAVYTPAFSEHRSSTVGAYVEALFASGYRKWDSRPTVVDGLTVTRPPHVGAPTHVRFRYDGVRFFGAISYTAFQASGGDNGALQKLQESVGGADMDALLASLPTDRYRAAWADLQRLPQLFIAV